MFLMDFDNIRQKLRKFISGSLSIKRYSDDDSFREGGIIDSVGIIELAQFVEDEFAIILEFEDMVEDNFDSVNKIATFIVKKKSGKDQNGALLPA